MRRLFASLLVCAPLSLGLIANSGCGATSTPPGSGSDTTTDGGTTTDAGTTTGGAFVNQSKGHESYVPTTEHPTSAARMIVVGDSISAGYGASNADTLAYYSLLQSNDNKTWPTESNTSLQAAFKATVPILSVAHPGDTTDNLADQQTKLRTYFPLTGPSIVVITIGGNDLQGALFSQEDPQGAVMTNAKTNLQNFIKFLQDPKNFPDGTDIYVMDVYDPTDGEGKAPGCFLGQSAPQFIPALDKWRDMYIQMGTDMGFAVVDALKHFHGHGANFNDKTNNQYYNTTDNTRWFANDCIHPNDRGHDELRRLFFEAINWSYVATP